MYGTCTYQGSILFWCLIILKFNKKWENVTALLVIDSDWKVMLMVCFHLRILNSLFIKTLYLAIFNIIYYPRPPNLFRVEKGTFYQTLIVQIILTITILYLQLKDYFAFGISRFQWHYLIWNCQLRTSDFISILEGIMTRYSRIIIKKLNQGDCAWKLFIMQV